MKIDPNSPIPFDPGQNYPWAKDSGPKPETNLRFNLEKARQMTTEALTLPDIRKERVEALRMAIAEGRYHVSSGQIAEAMLKEWLRPARNDA